MCLLLGTSGVGKTLLMKRLEDLPSITKTSNGFVFEDVPATIATVGTNLVNVAVRRQEVTVRELGGCMGPIWKNYFQDCSALMFMVDISNRLQVAAACIQLLSLLSAHRLANVPVLILYNKIDLPQVMTMAEMDSLVRLDDVLRHCPQTVQQVAISARTGHGLHEVLRWLEHNCSGK